MSKTRERRARNTPSSHTDHKVRVNGKSSTSKRKPPHVSIETMRATVYLHLAEINSPRSLSIYLIMRETDKGLGAFDDEILSLQTDPAWFLSPADFQGFYDPTELVRKWTGLVISWDPEQYAREKFAEAEEQCKVTNSRILHDSICGSAMESSRLQLRSVLSNILGPVDNALLQACVRDGGWGKGSTSSCKGEWVTEYHKLEATPQATRSFLDLGRSLMDDVSPLWSSARAEAVEGSRLDFVPKDAKTHRCIAIEPSLNMFLQRGIGNAIRRRIHRRWNLDLNSDQRNQRLAFEGSVNGSYATIDLSSASDTIAYQVIADLIPSDWGKLLHICRSSTVLDNGKPRILEKWSSMGNGYTWELESLLFASFVRICIDREDWYAGNWSVYGDDIIVPTYAYEKICNLLSYYGFSLNTKKTHASGPFRESCGADWWDGKPVRPFYLKEVNWLTLVNYANWLRLNPRPWRVKRTWISIRLSLGLDFPVGPAGDHGLALLFVDPVEAPSLALKPKISLRGRLGSRVEGYRFKPRKFPSSEIDGPIAVVAHLRLLTARSSSFLISGTSRAKLAKEPLSDEWYLTARQSGSWVRSRTLILDEWPVLHCL